MLLPEAKRILKKNGYILESETVNADFHPGDIITTDIRGCKSPTFYKILEVVLDNEEFNTQKRYRGFVLYKAEELETVTEISGYTPIKSAHISYGFGGAISQPSVRVHKQITDVVPNRTVKKFAWIAIDSKDGLYHITTNWHNFSNWWRGWQNKRQLSSGIWHKVDLDDVIGNEVNSYILDPTNDESRKEIKKLYKEHPEWDSGDDEHFRLS